MYQNGDIETDICRACLTNSCVEMKSLLDKNLSTKFEKCTSLEILEDDSLPLKLCTKCSSFVLQWFDFKQRCAKSEFFLLKQLGKIEVLDEEPDLGQNYGNLVTPIKSQDINSSISDYSPDESEVDDDSDTDFVDKLRNSRSEREEPTFLLRRRSRAVKGNAGKCSKCEKEFAYLKAFQKHFEACDRETKLVKACKTVEKKKPKVDVLFCGICSLKCKNITQLHDHLNDHKESGNLSCQMCDKKAIDFADLLCHRFEHQEKGCRLKIHCFLCSRKFTKEDRLEFHFRGIHLNKTPGLCKICGKTFMDLKYFMFHKSMHTGNMFKCENCEKSFTNKRSIRNHMKTHSDKREYVCHLCGFSCKLPAGLVSHQLRKHSGNQQLPCSHCGKRYKNKATLHEHLLRVNGERNYGCPCCGKRFRTQKQMEYHKKFHSDKKSFFCKHCKKSYKRKAHLKAHLYQHTGERRYECDICACSFMTASVLRTHRMIHTGERPFKCQHCDKGFIKSSNLKAHLRTHRYLKNTIIP